jgi:hypothetical protein
MKRALTIVSVAVVAGLPLFAVAQPKKSPPEPGQSEYAPGQRADEPGEAKKYAPGQRRKKSDDKNYPGASEYAPGQQPTPKAR